jgi:uncharacterized protein
MAQSSVDIAKLLYASFRRKDAESITALFSNDAVVHGPTASKEVLPWGGSFTGTEGVKQFFRLLCLGLDIEQLDIIDFISEKEKVVVLGYLRGKSKTTSKPFETFFAHVLKIDLNSARIVEFRVFNDSAALALSMQS